MLRAIQSETRPLASEHIASVFREIMSSCWRLSSRCPLPFWGPGDLPQAAALKHFGQSAIPQGRFRIHEVLGRLKNACVTTV